MTRLIHYPSFIAPIVLSLTLSACSDSNVDREEPYESMVAMNQVQYLGTHNSYHVRIRDDIFQLLLSFIPDVAPTLDYSQVPLTEQFESQGVRHIELDVFHDPEGGLYADRHALVLFDEDIASGISELSEPGLKVLHVQEIDYQTSCYTFVSCLAEVKAWSDSNPDHLPIMILVEAKDEAIADPLDLGFSIPLPIDESALDTIDKEILSIFPAAQLITPDFVRGNRNSLEEAVLNDGWPLLQEARGRIMFALDNGGATRDMYTDGHPSLEGRVMFTDSAPGTPEAAFIKQNDPSDFMAIQQRVQQGYMVRTRADADTEQARTGDTTRRETALESGAHFISTDYPVPDTRFSDYQVQIPGDNIARCNPVNAGTDCSDSSL